MIGGSAKLLGSDYAFFLECTDVELQISVLIWTGPYPDNQISG